MEQAASCQDRLRFEVSGCSGYEDEHLISRDGQRNLARNGGGLETLMSGRFTAMWRVLVACCLAAALPAISQNTQQQPSTQPVPGKPQGQNPGGRPPSKPGGDMSIQPYPNPSRPPKPGGDVSIQPYPNPPKPPQPGPRPPNPGPKPPPPGGKPPGIYPPPPKPPGPKPPPPRPPSWGRPPQNRPPYQWRPGDWDYLHRYYYRNLGYISRAGRPVWIAGGFIPYGYISYLTPLPPHLYGYLPPPPPGYSMGYFQGYVVVYDPRTGFIVNVVDLLR